MDRCRASAPQHSAAVRTAGSAALDLLLPAAAGKCGDPAPDAKAGSVVHEAPVLRQPQNGRRVRRGPSSRPAVDADIGDRSALPPTPLEPSRTGAPDLPIPVARR